MDYRPRVIDDRLKECLQYRGAVLVEGPKWCGKTTTSEQFAASSLKLSKVSTRQQVRNLLEIDTDAVLQKPAPLLIDEWQTVPELWDAVRSAVDERHKPGQFILTGSAVPSREEKEKIYHSGAGRFSWITMRTMSLFESGDSTGAASIKELFDDQWKGLAENRLNLRDIAFLMCRGGWPEAVTGNQEFALMHGRDYFDAVVQEDIIRVDGIRRSATTAQRLMRAYARNQGSQASLATLRADLKENEGESINEDTISDYLKALRQIFVIEDMPAWSPNLRSRTAIRTRDTRYFTDPSIATNALRIGPEDLINDLNTMGLLFESMCVRDLRVYAQALDGEVFHYRDKSGLECDAVVHLHDGRYGLIEIKLGGDTLISEGVKSLNALADNIDNGKMPAPSFKMVLTAVGDYGYRRPDGILVMPIGALRP